MAKGAIAVDNVHGLGGFDSEFTQGLASTLDLDIIA